GKTPGKILRRRHEVATRSPESADSAPLAGKPGAEKKKARAFAGLIHIRRRHGGDRFSIGRLVATHHM
ncbi:hypothetical protein ACH55_23665, partial [Salmonella enterica subsp. enterica serovar Typhimurium]